MKQRDRNLIAPCPFCHTRNVVTVDETPEVVVAEHTCTYCEKSYRYVVDGPSTTTYPRIVTLRENEYQAIRAN